MIARRTDKRTTSPSHAAMAMRIAVAALLCAPAGDALAGRRVTVTRDTIETLGATRLADLFAVVDAWGPQSADGYTVSPTPRALALPRAAQWSLYLNGQRLDVQVFDALHLEMVPVSLAEIDSVVFADESAPGAAWEGARGRVDIHAARARGGWTAGGAASAARETGDNATLGPDGSLWVARAGGAWHAALSAAVAEFPFTDPAMRSQNQAMLQAWRPGAVAPEDDATAWFYDPGSPSLLRTAASLRGGVRAGGHWQEALLSYQNARRYFHYSEPFGRSVPTDQSVASASLAGRAGLADGVTLGYRAAASQSQLADQDGVLAFDYDWGVRRARGGADLERTTRATRTVLFASVEGRRVSTADTLTRDEDTFTRAGLSASRRLSPRLRAGVDAAGTFADGDAAASLGLSAHWVVRAADTLRVRVRTAQRLFVEDDNLWLWSERGYDLLARNGIAYTSDGPVTRTTVSSADVGWTSAGVLGGVDVDLGLRRFDDAYVDTRAFTYDAATCTFASPTHVATGQAGHVALVRARLWHAFGARSWGDFAWTYTEEFDSDAAFGAQWQTVPRHHLSYTAYGRLGGSARLRVRVAHASSTFWPDYAGVDGATCTSDGTTVAYHARVPAYTTVDAGLQVSRWGERTVLDLVAKNLFDTTVRNHPAGAAQALTLAAQLRVQLGAP